MLHTAIPQLPHVTYSYTSTTTCYIQLYLNYHMLHTAIPQLPHVTYSYTSTTTCYIQLYLNYHMLHTAIPQLPHVTYSYTSTTTCYIQLYLNYHITYNILPTYHKKLPHVTVRLILGQVHHIQTGYWPQLGLPSLSSWLRTYQGLTSSLRTTVFEGGSHLSDQPSTIARHAFQELVLVHCRTEPFIKSVIPHMIRLLNN